MQVSSDFISTNERSTAYDWALSQINNLEGRSDLDLAEVRNRAWFQIEANLDRRSNFYFTPDLIKCLVQSIIARHESAETAEQVAARINQLYENVMSRPESEITHNEAVEYLADYEVLERLGQLHLIKHNYTEVKNTLDKYMASLQS